MTTILLSMMVLLLSALACRQPDDAPASAVVSPHERDSINPPDNDTFNRKKPLSPPGKKKKTMGRLLNSALGNNRFDPQKWLDDDRSFPPPGPPGRISRFDPIIKKMARRYGFDWRLIAAQIYAESRFDSTARSRCGARGLMQLMPATATSIGTDPLQLELPDVNIAAGCLYDRKMISLWKKNVDHPEDQLAFALASYNAGRGRVLRSFSVDDSLSEWRSVYPLLPEETQDYVHRIALKHDFYQRHALP